MSYEQQKLFYNLLNRVYSNVRSGYRTNLFNVMKVEIEQTENDIDWNLPQLVVSEDTKRIVQVSERQDKRLDNNSFCGQDLSDGCYCVSWSKSCFSKFTGKLTIKND